ncbi:hypothetical protein D9M71_715280 [compost metagenome]
MPTLDQQLCQSCSFPSQSLKGLTLTQKFSLALLKLVHGYVTFIHQSLISADGIGCQFYKSFLASPLLCQRLQFLSQTLQFALQTLTFLELKLCLFLQLFV